MKKFHFIILILITFLTACSPRQQTPPPAPTPVYDTPPAESGEVYIDGTKLTTYGDGLVKLSDFTSISGGTVETMQALTQPYICQATRNGNQYTVTTDHTTVTSQAGDITLPHTPLFDGTDWYVSKEIMGEGYHSYEDKYFTRYPTQTDEGVHLPVLMYHAVNAEPWSPITSLFVKPQELEKQLQYLKENGYTTVTFEDMDRLAEIEKPVMLTFDDGYDDNYTEAFPLLKKYGAKATFFVITDSIGTEHYMTAEQIKEVSDSGLVSIQSHTVTHPFLSDLGEEQLETEMTESKKALAAITGKEPFVLCYPTGKSSELSLKKTAEHFSFGLLMNGGAWTSDNESRYRITRSFVARNTSISGFASML